MKHFTLQLFINYCIICLYYNCEPPFAHLSIILLCVSCSLCTLGIHEPYFQEIFVGFFPPETSLRTGVWRHGRADVLDADIH